LKNFRSTGDLTSNEMGNHRYNDNSDYNNNNKLRKSISLNNLDEIMQQEEIYNQYNNNKNSNSNNIGSINIHAIPKANNYDPNPSSSLVNKKKLKWNEDLSNN
jgi:hypothetical protein